MIHEVKINLEMKLIRKKKRKMKTMRQPNRVQLHQIRKRRELCHLRENQLHQVHQAQEDILQIMIQCHQQNHHLILLKLRDQLSHQHQEVMIMMKKQISNSMIYLTFILIYLLYLR